MSDEMVLVLDELKGIRCRLDELNAKIDRVDAKTDALDAKTDALQSDLKSVKLRIENEISVNIQRVAEGHLDLSRNLHDAMRPSSEMEMLAIRVRMLEGEVKELRRKLP